MDRCRVIDGESGGSLMTINMTEHKQSGIGFQVWPCAHDLCQFVQESPMFSKEYWKGKRVLELGSGCGLVGLHLGCLGANVVMTDCEDVIEHTRANMNSSQNKELVRRAGGCVGCEVLAWGQPSRFQPAEFDVVIASDCVYHEHLFDPFLRTLASLSSPANYTLLCHEWRRLDLENSFFETLCEWGFSLEVSGSIAGAGLWRDPCVNNERNEIGSRQVFRIVLTNPLQCPGELFLETTRDQDEEDVEAMLRRIEMLERDLESMEPC